MESKKVWFITGCDSGMGHTAAKILLEKGDRVVVTALHKKNIFTLLDAYPENARGYELDVKNTLQIKKVVEQAVTDYGSIDVLFNNAGYGIMGAAEETTEEDYRNMFDVNLFGLIEVTKAVLPHMRKKRAGYIFNTSSLGGYSASPGVALYAASKFAVEGFSDALSQEVEALGIKVAVLEPGSFRTKFAGTSLQRIPSLIKDYEKTAVGNTTNRLNSRDGCQPNDPAKLAEILYVLSRKNRFPFRLQFGEDAISRVRTRLEVTQNDLNEWESVGRSCSF